MSHFNVTISEKPDFCSEAILSLYEYKWNQIETILNSEEKYGQSKEALTAAFSALKKFRDTSLKEIFSDEKRFEYLFKFVDKDITKFPYLLRFYFYCGEKLCDDFIEENADKLIAEFVLDRINDIMEVDESIKEITSMDEIFSLLNSPLVEDNERMLILETYGNRHKLYNCLKDYLNYAKPILIKNFYMIEDEFNSSVNYLKGIENWERFYGYYSTCFDDSVNNLKINSGIILFNKIWSVTNEQKGDFSMIGMKYTELKEWERNAIVNNGILLEYLKVLADGTRLKILNVLRNKSMRIKDLAAALKLTAPTISHHMAILQRYGLVGLELGHFNDNTPSQYKINEDRINEICELIHSITTEDTNDN